MSIRFPVNTDPAIALKAFQTNDARFKDLSLLVDGPASVFLSSIQHLGDGKIEVDSDRIVAASQKKFETCGNPVLTKDEAYGALAKGLGKVQAAQLKATANNVQVKAEDLGEIHAQQIWDLTTTVQPRPQAPRTLPRISDPLRLFGEQHKDIQYALVFNGDRSLQALVHRENAPPSKLAERMPQLANVHTVAEGQEIGSKPLAERIESAEWTKLPIANTAHSYSVTDTTPQEFGKNMRVWFLDRQGNLKGASEFTNENNQHRFITEDWRGNVIGRNSTPAVDTNGPRIDMSKIHGGIKIMEQSSPAVRRQHFEAGLNMPTDFITGFVGAKDGLISDGGSMVEIKAGTSDHDQLSAFVPYLNHEDGTIRLSLGSAKIPETSFQLKSNTLGAAFHETVSIASEGMTPEQTGKGDKLQMDIPLYFLAVPEADDVNVGGSTLSKLFGEGSCKFDKDGTETNGIILDRAMMLSQGIQTSVMGVSDGDHTDQIARIQLPAEWVSGDTKGYSLEVGVKKADGKYDYEEHNNLSKRHDIQLRIDDATWFHSSNPEIRINVRNAEGLPVSSFKLPINAGNDTVFKRDFMDLDNVTQYSFMAEAGDEALAAFRQSSQFSMKGFNKLTEAYRSVRSSEGLKFSMGAGDFRIVERATAYEALGNDAEVASIKEDLKANKQSNSNYWVVQQLGADGAPGNIVRDATDAVHTDVDGYIGINNMPGIANDSSIYVGGPGKTFEVCVEKRQTKPTPGDGQDEDRINAEAISESTTKTDIMWGGYNTPDKSNDGITDKDFAPKNVGTVADLTDYIGFMRKTEADLA